MALIAQAAGFVVLALPALAGRGDVCLIERSRMGRCRQAQAGSVNPGHVVKPEQTPPAYGKPGGQMNTCRVDPTTRLDRSTQRKQRMAWVLLVVAGLFEVGWAIGLKYTDGFTKPWPSIFTVAAMVISVVMLGIAMKSLPVGTSYAVWVGVGAVGTGILGIILFGEPATSGRLLSLGLIVAGIVGLKLASSA